MITDILECITDEINVNFPSASEVLYDENIFASYGFPGCIMALDFQKITINGIFFSAYWCKLCGSIPDD